MLNENALAVLPADLPGLLAATLVGSRVTCNPPPTDTDLDVLVLVDVERKGDLMQHLADEAYEHDGSDCTDSVNYDPNSPFRSFSLDEVNVIVTWSEEFHRRFLAASSVAKKLNLLNKADRVDLFQAVLYGNAVCAADDFDSPALFT